MGRVMERFERTGFRCVDDARFSRRRRGGEAREGMLETSLYPLRFTPIRQYRLWGGRRLAEWLGAPLPGDGPIGEAWLLSDRDDHPSRIAHGPLENHTLADLIARAPEAMLGRLAARFTRFPLLLKFLDVRKMLSVQVHPADGATGEIPAGETGKTEAWVVLEADAGSRIYAGLRPGVTAQDLRSITKSTADGCLNSFTPLAGQGVLIEAGTVHSLGDGVVVFEVQENSDVTFRLFDWDHVDPKTGQGRPLQVEQALACVDFAQGAIEPVEPVVEARSPVERERLFACGHFNLWRVHGAAPFAVGAANEPRVLVCVEGAGAVEFNGSDFAMEKGVVILLPACVGACRFRPEGVVTLLEIAVPDQ
jgi:mannose-6-phosphate isomerase